MDQEGLKMGQEGLNIVFWTYETCFFVQNMQFYVVRLALEPVGMRGACQQCWFATGIWTIPVWTDMTKGLTICLGCLKPI